MDRRPYYTARYATRRATGLCARVSCTNGSLAGQTLCEYHRDRNRLSVKLGAGKRRRMRQKRERLPDDRTGITQRFVIIERVELPNGESGVREVKGYFSSGEYEDGRLGELFVRLGKPGSSEALLDQWAISTSIALQYGASVGEVFGKFLGTSFAPAGAVQGVDGVKRCTSVLDLIARAIIRRYDVQQPKEMIA